MSEGQPLNGRRVLSISNTYMESIHVIRRATEQKTANDFTRQLFKDAIIDLFGGEAKIPANVKKAMLLADYDKGKPLTARRIIAVKVEIDKATAKMREAAETVKATLDANFKDDNIMIVADASKANGRTKITREQLYALAAVAVTRAAHDADALEVVTRTISSLILGGDGNFRSAESIQKKVDAIMVNMEELRTAAKGNKTLLAAGKAMIVQLHGTGIKRGIFPKMVKVFESMKTDAIRKLSPSCTVLQFHKAVAQFRDNLNNGINKTGLGTELLGGDEMQAARDFYAFALLSKCSRSTLGKMRNAFNSQAASKLLRIYRLISSRTVGPGPEISQGLKQYAADQGDIAKMMMSRILRMADIVCGIEGEDFEQLEEFDGELDYDALGAVDIMDDMVNAGRVAMDIQLKEFFAGCVGGQGKGADAMREIYSRKIGPEAYNPSGTIKSDFTNNAMTMLGWNIMTHCKKMAAGEVKDTVFYKDLVRKPNVNLPDGKKLSNDFDTACDQLTSFMTKGAKTSYAALDDREKAKVHILMSLLSQETMKAAFDGAAIALHPDKSTEAFMTINNEVNGFGSMEFTLSMDTDGSVKMVCACKKDVRMLMTFGENGAVKNTQTGAGSVMEAETMLTIRPDEMDRLAGLDFSKFDDAEAQRLYAGTSPDKLRTIYDSFPDGYKLTFDGIFCYSNFKATLND